MIRQGDLYWADFDEPRSSEPGYRHPVVVVQNNLFNDIPIKTVIVCLITSNLKYAKAAGNVALNKGEGNLLRPSVVNVTQLYTVNKADLLDYIGTLSPKRMRDILNGVKFVIEPREAD
jgi:mRNA interferase MazF